MSSTTASMALSTPFIAPSDDKLQVNVAEVLEYGGQHSRSWQSRVHQ